MKIKTKDTLDLYKNGMWIGTFESQDEIEEYFKNMEKNDAKFFSDGKAFSCP